MGRGVKTREMEAEKRIGMVGRWGGGENDKRVESKEGREKKRSD